MSEDKPDYHSEIGGGIAVDISSVLYLELVTALIDEGVLPRHKFVQRLRRAAADEASPLHSPVVTDVLRADGQQRQGYLSGPHCQGPACSPTSLPTSSIKNQMPIASSAGSIVSAAGLSA